MYKRYKLKNNKDLEDLIKEYYNYGERIIESNKRYIKKLCICYFVVYILNPCVKVKYRKLCYYKCDINIIYYNKENLDMMWFNIEYIKL